MSAGLKVSLNCFSTVLFTSGAVEVIHRLWDRARRIREHTRTVQETVTADSTCQSKHSKWRQHNMLILNKYLTQLIPISSNCRSGSAMPSLRCPSTATTAYSDADKSTRRPIRVCMAVRRRRNVWCSWSPGETLRRSLDRSPTRTESGNSCLRKWRRGGRSQRRTGWEFFRVNFVGVFSCVD